MTRISDHVSQLETSVPLAYLRREEEVPERLILLECKKKKKKKQPFLINVCV